MGAYEISTIPFEDRAPSSRMLCDALERITGQSVVCLVKEQRWEIEVDGSLGTIWIEACDDHTWTVDFNVLHPYLEGSLRLALNELGGTVRDAPPKVRPWAETPRWPYRARRWVRWAAMPLFIAVELIVAIVLIPVRVVNGLLGR